MLRRAVDDISDVSMAQVTYTECSISLHASVMRSALVPCVLFVLLVLVVGGGDCAAFRVDVHMRPPWVASAS